MSFYYLKHECRLVLRDYLTWIQQQILYKVEKLTLKFYDNRYKKTNKNYLATYYIKDQLLSNFKNTEKYAIYISPNQKRREW